MTDDDYAGYWRRRFAAYRAITGGTGISACDRARDADGAASGSAADILTVIAGSPIARARIRGTDTGVVMLPVNIDELREWARMNGLVQS